jgi:hypothetical protein
VGNFDGDGGPGAMIALFLMLMPIWEALAGILILREIGGIF